MTTRDEQLAEYLDLAEKAVEFQYGGVIFPEYWSIRMKELQRQLRAEGVLRT